MLYRNGIRSTCRGKKRAETQSHAVDRVCSEPGPPVGVPVAALDPLAPHPVFACNAVSRRRVSNATVSFLICAPRADNRRFVRELPTYHTWEWRTAARPYVAQSVATDLH